MPGQQKSGGGSKKIGRNKAKCERYKREDRRTKAKIKNYKEHNIPKSADEKQRKEMVSDFIDQQAGRKR